MQTVQVGLGTWEEDVRALAQEDYRAFIVTGVSVSFDSLDISNRIQSDYPPVRNVGAEIVRLLHSRHKVVLGPSTDFASMDGYYSPIRGQNVFIEQKLYVLAIDMGTDVILFGPATSHLDGPLELVADEQLQSAAMAKTRMKLSSETFQGTSGLLRVDLQFTSNPFEPYLVHIDRNPHVFATTASPPLDDQLVSLLFPGGHPALLDILLSNRFASAKDFALVQKVVNTYATYASTYDAEVSTFPYYTILRDLVTNFDWRGTVLDLGCGTGLLGELLHQKGDPVRIAGVDLSPHMTDTPAIAAHYDKPVRMEPVQVAIMRPDTYDHVACFGTVVYLSGVDFTAFLARTFMIARKSITFDIEDVSQDYLDKSARDTSILPSYNHTAAFRRFRIPEGWRIVHDEYGLLYHDSHETGCDIFDTMIRMERFGE